MTNSGLYTVRAGLLGLDGEVLAVGRLRRPRRASAEAERGFLPGPRDRDAEAVAAWRLPVRSSGSLPVFIAVSIVAFIILGSVLEGIPAIVLFGPLLFPIARQIGVHEVHYAMIVILAMGIGLFAPPFGVGYYAACAISRISPDEGMKPILGYLAALAVGLIVVAAFPWVSIGFLG